MNKLMKVFQMEFDTKIIFFKKLVKNNNQFLLIITDRLFIFKQYLKRCNLKKKNYLKKHQYFKIIFISNSLLIPLNLFIQFPKKNGK